MPRTIVWFRQDLRIKDNPALFEAAQRGEVVPVYILDTSTRNKLPLGEASKWWLHKSLKSLRESGVPLIIEQGNLLPILERILKQTESDAIYWNRCYEPHAIARDKKIKKELECTQSFNGSLLFEPWTIQTKSADFYKVFTPFWKACLASPDPRDTLSQPKLKWADNLPTGLAIEDLELLPQNPNWAEGFDNYWKPGEQGAYQKLTDFLENKLHNYDKGRDLPAEDWTSKLSPHLHWGEISPNQVWEAVNRSSNPSDKNTQRFLAELGWREFSYNLLYHFPDLPENPFQKKFSVFPWHDDEKLLRAWENGLTGFPLVDAGMRELWSTGYMHNRVRMIVASLLTKHCLIPWQQGSAWFWDTLVDADLANNSASWQWVAGCGADAAPFFRIFNPVTQSKKFDPQGDYIRRWVPELKHFSDKDVHTPWAVSEDTQKECRCTIGKDYPHPIVDLDVGRVRALQAYEVVKIQ